MCVCVCVCVCECVCECVYLCVSCAIIFSFVSFALTEDKPKQYVR